MRKIKEVVTHPIKSFERFLFRISRSNKRISDEEFAKKYYKIMFGKDLDLSNPKTFNEKLQWLKLNYRKSEFTEMVDKYLVKDYVKERIGENYVVPLLGVWNSFDDIDFDKLPNSFVLKLNHLSGGQVICKDKNLLNLARTKKIFDEGLKKNYYQNRREWPYKNIERKIIAEEYIKDAKNETLPVYKFFCFDGEPFIIQVIQNDKKSNETIDYYDINWELLGIQQNFPNSKVKLSKPNKLGEMLEICRKLTKGFPFLRCDLYLANDNIYFSEFTFFSDAGFEPFHPAKWDDILGSKIRIPDMSVKE